MTHPLPTDSARPRARWTLTLAAAGVVVLAATAPVLGKIVRNTIEGTASLHAGGRLAEGVVLIACTPGLRLTLTQGAVIGEGRTQGECLGEEQVARYPVTVVARGRAGFQAGPAEACAMAINTDRGQVVETRQWCRAAGPVELVEE